jgi:flagellar biogenesis protein FliO
MTAEAWAARPGTLWLRACSVWERIARIGRRAPRRLRLSETLPLGERRFVAVIEFEHSRFLVGGTASSLVLLAQLGSMPGEVVPLPAQPSSRLAQGGRG